MLSTTTRCSQHTEILCSVHLHSAGCGHISIGQEDDHAEMTTAMVEVGISFVNLSITSTYKYYIYIQQVSALI
jgi:hypothetical protein